MAKNELKNKIEELRKKMIKSTQEKNNLHNKEIVILSQKLDKLLNKYME